MPHITIHDPVKGKASTGTVMCVERDTQSCIILGGNPDDFDTLVQIANSLKANQVLVIADPTLRDHLLLHGWKPTDYVVLTKS